MSKTNTLSTTSWADMISSDSEDEVPTVGLVLATKQEQVLMLEPPILDQFLTELKNTSMNAWLSGESCVKTLFPGSVVEAPKPQLQTQETESSHTTHCESKVFVHVFVKWVKPRKMTQALFDLLLSDYSLNSKGMRLNLGEAHARYLKADPTCPKGRVEKKRKQDKKDAKSIAEIGSVSHELRKAASKADFALQQKST